MYIAAVSSYFKLTTFRCNKKRVYRNGKVIIQKSEDNWWIYLKSSYIGIIFWLADIKVVEAIQFVWRSSSQNNASNSISQEIRKHLVENVHEIRFFRGFFPTKTAHIINCIFMETWYHCKEVIVKVGNFEFILYSKFIANTYTVKNAPLYY